MRGFKRERFMDCFAYRGGVVCCEGVSFVELAGVYGTPLYIYSQKTLEEHCRKFVSAFSTYPTLCCYAVKANSNLSILRTIFGAGFGADVVSVGEIERALMAGVAADKIVFSGVGKRFDEVRRAVDLGILLFNVESEFEVELLRRACGELSRGVSIALRINPDIDALTNPKITTGLHGNKFGVTEAEAVSIASRVRGDRHIKLVGLSCHIGSQIVDIRPIEESAARLVHLADEFVRLGHSIKYVDVGGGLGVRYREEVPPSIDEYAEGILKSFVGKEYKLIIEPGRSVVANAGALLTKVIGVKARDEKVFVVLDVGMNDLLRPTLYEAYHDVLSVVASGENALAGKKLVDFVGPICETGDYIAKGRLTSLPCAEDLLCIRTTGAYAMSMASNYNSRFNPAEVMVSGETHRLIRRRQNLNDICAAELEFLK